MKVQRVKEFFQLLFLLFMGFIVIVTVATSDARSEDVTFRPNYEASLDGNRLILEIKNDIKTQDIFCSGKIKAMNSDGIIKNIKINNWIVNPGGTLIYLTMESQSDINFHMIELLCVVK